MNNESLAKKLLELCGGASNVKDAENCMTRLRVELNDSSKADIEAIKKTEDVMGVVPGAGEIQIVLGPGKVARVAECFLANLKQQHKDAVLASQEASQGEDWQANKEAHKKNMKTQGFQRVLKTISQIFVPLIPGIMAAGLVLGISEIINALIGAGTLPKEGWAATIALMLNVIGQACFGFLAVFVGINSAKVFKCTTVLGGMVGALVMFSGVAEFAASLSKLISLSFNCPEFIFNAEFPGASLLTSGKGGVIGVIAGVWILSKLEHAFRKKVPDTLDLIVTPLVSFLVVGILMLIVIMPIAGIISDGIANGMHFLGTSNLVIVKAIYGFLLGALYLPLVLFGLHQGLFPFYTIEIQTVGYTMMICPQLMAGMAQVGAAIAIYIKARQIKHDSLCTTIAGALPAGILGIGEPLIYGMSLPLLIVFVPIGIAAGIAGIFIVLMGCQATSFGPSAILAIPTMKLQSMLPFAAGEGIAVVLGFVFTWFMVSKNRIQQHKDSSAGDASSGVANFNELVRS